MLLTKVVGNEMRLMLREDSNNLGAVLVFLGHAVSSDPHIHKSQAEK
jgi:hypothetical protein